MAKPSDIDKYRDVYKVGYEAIRQARFEKQKTIGLVADELPASEPAYTDWETVEDKEQEALEMAVYAAMIDCLDQNIGRLMGSLENEGIADNTVVFFLFGQRSLPNRLQQNSGNRGGRAREQCGLRNLEQR